MGMLDRTTSEPKPNRPPLERPATYDRPLSPAAERALAEAEARRKEAASLGPKEVGGRQGPDPTRYGDWEKDGLAKDF